jgi:FKBP-type peptidyl-prolyl cis-trans isomerase FkpA
MKKFLSALGVVATLFFVNCKKDDDVSYTPPRPYDEVYAENIAQIEEYLQTHSISVTKNGNGDVTNVVFDTITDGTTASIYTQTDFPIKTYIFKSDEVEYKIYYLQLDDKPDNIATFEDITYGNKPSGADAVITSYKGYTLNGNMFDSNEIGAKFDLTGVIAGWQLIIPQFRSGSSQFESDGTLNYTNYGSGVMFVPSGLAYFNNGSSGIPAYAPLIFTFNLNQVFYLDQDGDGILSRYEFGYSEDGKLIDTDGDGIPNYLDRDDDNDGYLTLEEIKINGVIPPFEDILNCQGTTGGLKKHLDPTCH